MDSLQRVFGVNGASGKPLHLCPNCGADVMAATWTERVIGQRVSNIWSCGTCEREFETTIFGGHSCEKRNELVGEARSHFISKSLISLTSCSPLGSSIGSITLVISNPSVVFSPRSNISLKWPQQRCRALEV
jgi:hypothetical protein